MPEDNELQPNSSERGDVVVQTGGDGEEAEGSSEPAAGTLSDAPPDVQQAISLSRFVAAYSGPVPNPLVDKLTDVHIDKMLDYGEAHSQRQDRQTHSARRTVLVAAMAGGLTTVVVFLVLVFQGESDLASEFLAGIIGLLGGGGLGYGLGRRR